VTSSAFGRSLGISANLGLLILYFLKQRSRSKAGDRDATLATNKLIRDHVDRSSHAPSPTAGAGEQPDQRPGDLVALRGAFKCRWTGHKSSSAFSDRPPAKLGAFASLDRF
jgi:hypothetical protein